MLTRHSDGYQILGRRSHIISSAALAITFKIHTLRISGADNYFDLLQALENHAVSITNLAEEFSKNCFALSRLNKKSAAVTDIGDPGCWNEYIKSLNHTKETETQFIIQLQQWRKLLEYS